MLPQTRDVLSKTGYLSGGAADRDKLADDCLQIVLGNTIRAVAQIDPLSTTLLEFRSSIFGTQQYQNVEEELHNLIREITTVRPEGRMQKKLRALADGRVMCSSRVERIYQNGSGDPVAKKESARWVTDDDDLVETYFLSTEQDSTIRKAQGLQARYDFAVAQRPALAARRQILIPSAHARLQAELTA